MLDIDGTPMGCNIASHVVHNFCAACPRTLLAAELVAWRTWAAEHVPEVRQAIIERWERSAGNYWEQLPDL